MPRLLRILKAGGSAMKDCLLPGGEVSAYVLRHFEASIDGKLSLFEISSDISVDEIALAIASTRRSIDDVEFCIVDAKAIADLSIQTESCRGETGIDKVDLAHLDLTNLTSHKSANLVEMCVDQAEMGSLSAKEIGVRLALAFDGGYVPLDKVPDGLRVAIEGVRGGKNYRRAKIAADQLAAATLHA